MRVKMAWLASYYMPEKRAALEQWAQRVRNPESAASDVMP